MRFFNKNKGSNGLGEEGLATVYLVLFLVFFIAPIFALAIDFAYLYVVRGQLQNAADAAALAGASKIEDLNDPVQSDARAEAVVFAAKNHAAREPVYLENDGFNNLSSNNDITVGFWDGSAYNPGTSPYNAIHVVARRTSNDGGDVDSTFGLLLTRYLGEGGVSINISDATAFRPPGPTTAMSFCTDFCNQLDSSFGPAKAIFQNFTGAGKTLYFKENDLPVLANGTTATWLGVAWTEYSPSRATNFGPDSDIAKMIRGELKLGNMCTETPYDENPDQWYTTNNAAPGQIMTVIENEFAAKGFTNSSTGEFEWTVTAPLFGRDENGTVACPPGVQPDEPYTVEAYAKIKVIGVNGNPTPSITIRSIRCIHCDDPALDDEIISRKSVLVE